MESKDNFPAVTGAALLAQTVHHFGLRQVFHIPGEGALEILDALAQVPDMQLTVCRNEAGMCYAAQGWARAVVYAQPGVCLVGRSTGALNAALALHTADTDAVPLIFLIGQAAWDEAGGDKLTGFDLVEVFKPMVKAVLPVAAAQRIPEVLAQAWHVAKSSRMGPVVVLLPEDVVRQSTTAALLDMPICLPPAPSLLALREFAVMAEKAKQPLLLVGGSGWAEEDVQALRAFVKASGWPVACAYRRADLLDQGDTHFVGELGIGADAALLAAVAEADCLVVLNMRLGEINTFGSSGGFGGWKLLARPRPQQYVVHVHADVRELQRNYHTELAILAAPGEFLRAALAALSLQPLDGDWRARLRSDRENFVTGGKPCPGPVDVRAVMQHLRTQLSLDTPVCVGAGAYAVWLHRYFSFHHPNTLLGPKSGAMGYGLAAAVGAARARPGKTVLALAGDGCLQMHAEELATAVQYRLPIVLIVMNNAAYAAIEGAQRGLFGRSTGTRLARVDFAAWARSMGAQGMTVQDTAAFAPALAQALAALPGGPVVLDVVLPDGLGKPQ